MIAIATVICKVYWVDRVSYPLAHSWNQLKTENKLSLNGFVSDSNIEMNATNCEIDFSVYIHRTHKTPFDPVFVTLEAF